MRYETINWDDGWADLVDPIVDAHESDKPSTRLEEKYDRRYVESASCRLYAERLLENLQSKNEKFQFACHTDATAWPRNSYWRVLVRKADGKPLTGQDLAKLKRAAKAILRNIEKKYPGIGDEEQRSARQSAERQLKKDAAAIGLGVRLPGDKQRSGCLTFLAIVFALLAALSNKLCSAAFRQPADSQILVEDASNGRPALDR